MKRWYCFILACIIHIPLVAGAQSLSDGELNLQQCLKKALKFNPALETYRSEIKVKDGLIEQADLPPNPELEFELENILGTGQFQGFDGFETTLALRQRIETAAKRTKRTDVSRLEKESADWSYQQACLQLLHNTTQAFIDLLAAQEHLALQTEFYQISQRVYEVIKAGVEAGRDSPLEEKRSRVTLVSSKIDRERAKRDLEMAKITLARQWGDKKPTFDTITGDLFDFPALPDVDQLQRDLAAHPQVAKRENIIDTAEAALTLEEAKAVPDVNVGAGIRYHSDAEEGAFLIGVSIPLPIFDRNQGAIRAAKASLEQTKSQYQSVKVSLAAQLRSSHLSYLQAYDEYETLNEEILPTAQQAFESVQLAYQQGKYPYINVLDSQRSLFQLKQQLIEAAQQTRLALNQIYHLTSRYTIEEPEEN